MNDSVSLVLLEDERALGRLINRYQRAADRLDIAAAVDCFDVNGSFKSPFTGMIQGKDQIRASIDAAVSGCSKTHHMMTNVDFDVDGNTATGHGCVSFVLIYPDDGPAMHITGGGHYDWEFVKTDGGWKIEKLSLVQTWMSQIPRTRLRA